MNNIVHLVDCMELMKDKPDNYYDLAIVDPPYGIGISNNPIRQAHGKKNWDNTIPAKSYFEELKRVSKNQIIWGGNYFDLPPTQNYIVWDKIQPQNFSLAMAELAWCSVQHPIRIFKYSILNEKKPNSPTQKPVALYNWLLAKYAKPGDKILDTHVGSGSSRIAAYEGGFWFEGAELDPDYFNAQELRFKNHIKQARLAL